MPAADASFQRANRLLDLRRAQFVRKFEAQRDDDLAWRKVSGQYTVRAVDPRLLLGQRDDRRGKSLEIP
jgi:hypothetical protein